jgi:hypothetical protein
MQIVKGNFEELQYDKLLPYLNIGEICIRDLSNNNLYGRSYKYSNFGICNIYDRPLGIIYEDEIKDSKHHIHFKF